MAFPSFFLDQVKDQVGLADFIGKRVKLIKRGRDFLGLCPFHNEKTPSFTVNEEKGFFHCFGCGEHGSLFDFVMKIDNMSFRDAVERLAEDAGIPVPELNTKSKEQISRQKRAFDLLEHATCFYEENLTKGEGHGAFQYLIGRGLNKEIIKKFRLGFAGPGSTILKDTFLRRGFDEKLMLDVGLIVESKKGGKPYDRFRNRIIFPVENISGKIIAFGGRVMGDGEPKYLNSPETQLFQKRNNLYGMRESIDYIRKNGEAIVVEGYTDVIALHQHGFPGSVSPLGTALSESQMQLIWKYCRNPVLCFDGDIAGSRAAVRAAERALPLIKPGLSLNFVVLDEGHDPDSILTSKGASGFENVLSKSITLSDLIWKIELQSNKLETPEERSWLEKRLEEKTSQIVDPSVRKYYQDEFKNRLWRQFRYFSSSKKPGRYRDDRFENNRQLPAMSGVKASVDSKFLSEAILVYTVISHPGLFHRFAESLGTLSFDNDKLDKLRQEVLKTFAAPDVLKAEPAGEDGKTYVKSISASLGVDENIQNQVFSHAKFARPEEDDEFARVGWEQQLRIYRREQILQEIEATKNRLNDRMNNEDLELLKLLKQQVIEIEEASFLLDDSNSEPKGSKSAA
ncbi:MAG: DNA primase [Alphaproteobacteria bacterium MarineAlpha3_Bin7]|nr:MAG: DNA primase [Alphaproteobacteria bacterium MarineAlpha3_Bin7]